MAGTAQLVDEETLHSIRSLGKRVAKVFSGLNKGEAKLYTANDFDLIYGGYAGSSLYDIYTSARAQCPPDKRCGLIWQQYLIPLSGDPLSNQDLGAFLAQQELYWKDADDAIATQKFENKRTGALRDIEGVSLDITNSETWAAFTKAAAPEAVAWAETVGRLLQVKMRSLKRPCFSSRHVGDAFNYAGEMRDSEAQLVALHALKDSWEFGNCLAKAMPLPPIGRGTWDWSAS